MMSSKRRSARIAARVEDELKLRHQDIGDHGLHGGSKSKRSRSGISKRKAAASPEKKSTTTRQKRTTRSAPKRARGRPANEDTAAASTTRKSRRRDLGGPASKRARLNRNRNSNSNRFKAPSYFDSIPMEPLQDIVRQCSRWPDKTNWLTYLPSSLATALVKTGGSLADAASKMITAVEINQLPVEMLKFSTSFPPEMDNLLLYTPFNYSCSHHNNLLRISNRVPRAVHVLIKAAATNLVEIHLLVPSASLLEISQWIKVYCKNSVRKVVLGPTPDFDWNQLQLMDWLLTSHHIYCLLNACRELRTLEIRGFVLSLTVLGTIARHIENLEEFVVAEGFLESSLEPIWNALQKSLKIVRIDGVQQVDMFALHGLAKCEKLEKLEIKSIARSAVTAQQMQTAKALFAKNVVVNITVSDDPRLNIPQY